MESFDLGRVSCSAEVALTLCEIGISREELLKEHQATPPDDSCWVTSFFVLPNFDKPVWAITDTKGGSTILLFEGL